MQLPKVNDKEQRNDQHHETATHWIQSEREAISEANIPDTSTETNKNENDTDQQPWHQQQ